MGKHGRDKLYVQPREWYGENNVDLRLGTTVTGVDPSAHEIVLARRIPGWLLQAAADDRLVAAAASDAGRRPRRRAVPARGAGTATGSGRRSSDASRVAVIGAGWIGLETAAAARTAGAEVTVLEMAELPLLRVLGREVAEVFAKLHTDHGVDLRTGVQVAEITGSGGAANGVRLADGTHVDADVVIVGVGHHAERRACLRGRPAGRQRRRHRRRSCGPPTPTSSRPGTSRTRSTR